MIQKLRKKTSNPFIADLIAFLFFLFISLSFSACKKTGPTLPSLPEDMGYRYFCLGNKADTETSTSPGLVLMGGGSDVDEAFRWMIKQSGGGDFVVIRASGSEAYNPYIFSLGEVDSVETLVIYNRQGASDSFVFNKVINAEALFIAGGDQADYLRLWKGTPLNEAINLAIRQGTVIGGTSAGLAVLGEFIFAAYNGTVYSAEALANPYNSYVTLERNFLFIPWLEKVITDSHFVTRNRMGRLVVFLARIIKDDWSSIVKGIGIDEATALLIEIDGTVKLVGSGAAYFLLADRLPEVCQPGSPLSYSQIHVYRMQRGDYFNLVAWQGSGGLTYYLWVTSGTLFSSTGSIY